MDRNTKIMVWYVVVNIPLETISATVDTKTVILYVYLFQRDSYFSGISAASSVVIHEYANTCMCFNK